MINPINTQVPINNIPKIFEQTTQDSTYDVSFSDFLKKAVYDASDARKYTEELNNQLINGEVENIHDVTIAKGIADIKVQMVTEFTSKMVEAYKEILRMQI